MAMGNYSAMLQAGPPSMGYEGDGTQPTMVGNREGADSYRAQAEQLHGQLLQLQKQYGQAAVIPRNVASHIVRLKRDLDNSINQWQELTNRADADTEHTDAAMSALSGTGSVGALLGPDQPAGQGGGSIAEKLKQRGAGMKSNVPPVMK